MVKEFFIVIQNDKQYYAGCSGWILKFSPNKWAAEKFSTYKEAEDLITSVSSSGNKAYMPSGYYSIEKYYEVTDSQFD